MELKKNPSVDTSRQFWLYMLIGLAFSLSLSLMAFEYSFVETIDIANIGEVKMEFEEMQEVVATVQPPPPVPTIQQPEIKEVPDEKEVKQDIKMNLETEVTDKTPKKSDVVKKTVEVKKVEVKKEEVEEVFTIVEDNPEPEGGMQAFYKYVSKEMKYPATARRMGIEGKVFVQFIIDKEGNISDVKVVKGIHEDCDKEAIRVLEKAPKWKPGKQRGVPVKVKMSLPISFKLG